MSEPTKSDRHASLPQAGREAEAMTRPRRPYTTPRLEVVGHVREIVLGSIGVQPESGGGLFNFPS